MQANQSQTHYSIKCAVFSFVSTYISGVLHPLDLLKTRFQSHDGKSQAENLVPKYQGIWNGLRTIYRQQGFRGIYKGFNISVFSQASATAFFFWLYQIQKIRYNRLGYEDMNAVMFASIQASILGTIVTQPLWVIKTRMLLNTTAGITQLQNLAFSCRQIHQQGGMKGYTKGLGLSLLLSFSGVIQMYSYEGLKKVYSYLKIPQSTLLQKNFICGSFSKLFVVLATYPITTIRTRIQQNQFVKDDHTIKYSGIGQIIRKTRNSEGIIGFYKGFQANLIKGVFQRGIYFYCYELLKLYFQTDNQPTSF